MIATDNDSFDVHVGALTRVLEEASGPLVQVEPSVSGSLVRIVPLPAVPALFFFAAGWGGPLASLWIERPAGSGGGRSVAVPPDPEVWLDFAAGPRGLWSLASDGSGDSYRFTHHALPANTWSTWPSYFDGTRPKAIAVVDDLRGERLCLATAGFYVPGFEVEPRLRLFGPDGASLGQVEVGTEPESVRVIAVP